MILDLIWGPFSWLCNWPKWVTCGSPSAMGPKSDPRSSASSRYLDFYKLTTIGVAWPSHRRSRGLVSRAISVVRPTRQVFSDPLSFESINTALIKQPLLLSHALTSYSCPSTASLPSHEWWPRANSDTTSHVPRFPVFLCRIPCPSWICSIVGSINETLGSISNARSTHYLLPGRNCDPNLGTLC